MNNEVTSFFKLIDTIIVIKFVYKQLYSNCSILHLSKINILQQNLVDVK